MTSSIRAAIPMLGLLSIVACAPAFACDAQDRQIIAVKTNTIGSYTEGGKFDKDIKGTDVLQKRITGCSSFSSSLAKVMLNETEAVWIDLTEVKLTENSCGEASDSAVPVKVAQTYSRKGDTKEVTSSGISGCKST